MPHLEAWSKRACTLPGDAYKAPEQLLVDVLSGIVTGHPLRPEGRRITTSSIVKIDCAREVVITHSGSEYTLGEPCPIYVQWCLANNYAHPKDMFKVLKES